MAPAEVFATVAVSPTARRFGMITPCAPARFAVRMIAPRLCGSSILSRIKMNGGSPFSSAFFKISSTSAYSYAAATAMTPWCFFVSDNWSKRSLSTKLIMVSCFLASLTIVRTGPSWHPSKTNSLSIVFPERNASNTALRPSIFCSSYPMKFFFPFSYRDLITQSFRCLQDITIVLVSSLPRQFSPARPDAQIRLSDTDIP